MTTEELTKSFVAQADAITPMRLAISDLAHSTFNGPLWSKVHAWQPTVDQPWLGIVGRPGTCKTRCAYLRLRQFAEEDAAAWGGTGKPPTFDAMKITGMEFNRLVVDLYSRDQPTQETAAATLRRALSVDLLVFDELSKVKATPGTVSEIAALLWHRSDNALVTLWTANARPEQFCAAWGEEYAAPACGRIMEASTIITA